MVIPPGTTRGNTSCLCDERKLQGRSLTYMSELRIGVIGTGMMGCEHLRNLMGITNVAVTAVSDPHEEQHGWARHTLGNRASAVAEFTDHRDLLSSGLVDAADVPNRDVMHMTCTLNGEEVQNTLTDDLVFNVGDIIEYVSGIVELLPGDVIFTGTPGGVGVSRKPAVFLKPGDVLVSTIDGIGTTTNRCI